MSGQKRTHSCQFNGKSISQKLYYYLIHLKLIQINLTDFFSSLAIYVDRWIDLGSLIIPLEKIVFGALLHNLIQTNLYY